MPEDNRRSLEAVRASGCWECGEAPAPPMAYTIGEIDFDLPSASCRDSLIRQGVQDPRDPQQLLRHLEAHPETAAVVTWILAQETIPVYAIQPGGAFARATYERLRRWLQEQRVGKSERVAVPGWVSGTARLSNGHRVPVLWPEPRGLRSWSRPEAGGKISALLERVAYETRNLGLEPQERAINYAVTEAFQVERIFQSALEAHLRLDSIAVEPGPVCRPKSDCWDVKLTFFDPVLRLEQARVVYRFAVDVSDVLPVTLGKIRHWEVF